MVNMSDIGERVREGRRELGMTQTQLAERAGVSRPTIARVEHGLAGEVSFGTMLHILNAANWDLSLERGVAPAPARADFDMEQYLDDLFGGAR